MKIKTLLGFIIALLAISFIACDDDLHSVGSSIQTESDSIYVSVDTVVITAKTISLEDRIYARTAAGVLGEYIDPIFGKVKSDYLSEFYCPKDMAFKNKTFSIDSVQVNVVFSSFSGDSTNLMGISTYELNTPLVKNFYTNINPKDFYDPADLLGSGSFTVNDAYQIKYSDGSVGPRMITTQVDTLFGQRFLKEWKTNPGTFKDSESLRKTFFRGIYVTTNFGNGTLLNVSNTTLDIFYKYVGRNSGDTADSIRTSIFSLAVTPEVIQMNRIQNKIDPALLENTDLTRSYLKTPAGVATELTIPLGEIIRKMGANKIVNSATFNIKGFTEEETASKLQRPAMLLFVNSDSLPTFFPNKRLENNISSFLMPRNTGTNTYEFSLNSYNISQLINYYADHYKNMDKNSIPDLKYTIIPVNRLTERVVSGSSYVNVTSGIYNLMSPTSAILRTDEKNMKMGLIFSRYSDRE
ncbi:DUF4270 domain-containing protein [Dysgonomonas sp. ZJ279]|uniref:DUF4270 domain-containing protein n=1 Tax=Dysgonomonas sp. ZJ279 TaxID=2709796 RepID=UPI0013EE003C|nr:DUF4270 domain-containing protein [Dysgonomonas sp. ZJ279]